MTPEELCFSPAVEQRALLERREIGVLELIDAHIDRIERYNDALIAFLTLRLDEARDEARAADATLARGEGTGVLYGLPIGVKDCFATKGLRTTFGCVALADHVPDYDHCVVEREKAAGAIMLGKLNTPEFTMAALYNPAFGSARNPFDLSRTPGASSGGSAAALATGLVALADGSDIGGSVRNPAAWCNIVGHRPTAWLIPDIPNPVLWHNMNTPGPMARCVADAALLLSVLAGPDPRHPVGRPAPFPPGPVDLERDLCGLGIGWSRDHGSLPIDPDLGRNFDSQATIFESLGARVAPCDIDFEDITEPYDVLAYQRVSGDVKSVYETARDDLDAQLAQRYEWAGNLTGEQLRRAEERRLRLWRDVCAAFETHDVLVWPNDLCDPYGHDDAEAADAADWRLLAIAPMLGLPATTVPCGFSEDGLPRGLQITDRPGDDLLVLQVACAYEQATRYGATRPDLEG